MRGLLELINKEAKYEIANFEITVIILDVKNSWGYDKVLITPKHGYGQQWVLLDSIKIEEI